MTTNLNPCTNPDVSAAIAAGAANPTTGLAGDWSDFERMMRDDRWLGFGYLGERRNFIAGLTESGVPANVAADALHDVDELVHSEAAAKLLTYDQLFAWANAKVGRWFADLFLGAPVPVPSWTELLNQAERHDLLPRAGWEIDESTAH